MGKTYALSDIHGRYDLLEKILDFLAPDDKVYFLGDAADRGPDGWKCLTTIMLDPRFEYIMGNHELMLIDAIKKSYQYEWEYDFTEEYRLLINNGGYDTFYSWYAEDEERRIWYHQLRSLPYALSYTNTNGDTILLSHAGYTPWYNDTRGSIKVPCQYDLVWDRNHVLDKPTDEDWYPAFVVHGHTPTVFLAEDIGYRGKRLEPGAFYYAGGRKICIDNGSVWTGYACLFDLDTFEEHIFEIAEENENEF